MAHHDPTVDRGAIVVAISPMPIQLRRDLDVSRQTINNSVQYVLRDPLTFSSCSLTQADYQVFLHLEHCQSVAETFEKLVAEGIVGQDQRIEFYQFIMDLHRRNLIRLPIVDGRLLYREFSDRRKRERANFLMQLFSYQLPLFNPDRFLEATKRFAKPLFQPWSLIAWLVLAGIALRMIASQWSEFQDNAASLLALQSLPLILVILTALKFLHELGHAYACKLFGGNVPEIGLMLIVGTPCAYVDASSAWGFRNRWQRIIVNLAGMYFESLVAIAGVFVWSLTQPGLLNSIAHYVIVCSTAVTILFNANPLLKFDGYYIASDFFGIPNLKRLSSISLHHFCKRYFLGIECDRIGHTWWSDLTLASYGALSEVYKLLMVFGIVSMLSLQIPMIGLIMGFFYFFAVLLPILERGIRYLFFHPETASRRYRTTMVVGGSLAACAAVAMLPLSSSISFTGVVGRENETFIRSLESGFVSTVGFKPSQEVRAGQLLFELTNEELQSRRASAVAEVAKIRSQWLKSVAANAPDSGMLQQRLQQAKLNLQTVESAMDRLTIRAPQDGVLTEWQTIKFTGRFLQSGEPLIKLESGRWVVRAMATDEEVLDSQVSDGDAVEFELIGQPGKRLRGRVVSVSRSSQSKIEQPVLTQIGGGDIGIDPLTQKANRSYFLINMELEAQDDLSLRSGIRVQAMVPNRKWSLARSVSRKFWLFYHTYLVG